MLSHVRSDRLLGAAPAWDAVGGTRATDPPPRAAQIRTGAEQHAAWREYQRGACSGAAAVLGQLIEQMGGAPTSCACGAYVSLYA